MTPANPDDEAMRLIEDLEGPESIDWVDAGLKAASHIRRLRAEKAELVDDLAEERDSRKGDIAMCTHLRQENERMAKEAAELQALAETTYRYWETQDCAVKWRGRAEREGLFATPHRKAMALLEHTSKCAGEKIRDSDPHEIERLTQENERMRKGLEIATAAVEAEHADGDCPGDPACGVPKLIELLKSLTPAPAVETKPKCGRCGDRKVVNCISNPETCPHGNGLDCPHGTHRPCPDCATPSGGAT